MFQWWAVVETVTNLVVISKLRDADVSFHYQT